MKCLVHVQCKVCWVITSILWYVQWHNRSWESDEGELISHRKRRLIHVTSLTIDQVRPRKLSRLHVTSIGSLWQRAVGAKKSFEMNKHDVVYFHFTVSDMTARWIWFCLVVAWRPTSWGETQHSGVDTCYRTMSHFLHLENHRDVCVFNNSQNKIGGRSLLHLQNMFSCIFSESF